MLNPREKSANSNHSVTRILNIDTAKSFQNEREAEYSYAWVETEFVAVVNHKVTSCLLSARNALYLIAERYRDANLLKHLELVEAELANISRILSDARAEAGRHSMKPVQTEDISLQARG